MKNYTKYLKLSLFLVLLITITGCGVNGTMVNNVNLTQTVVELGEANYSILDRVQGEAQDSYVLFFGGRKVQALNDAAMADLLSKANLEGSQALANVTTERYYEYFILFTRVKVIASAHVVEFNDED